MIKTGVAPARAITSAVAKNEKVVVKTASPLAIPFAIRGIRSASVPDAHDKQ